jgi:Protein of unknown function (DUF2961)
MESDQDGGQHGFGPHGSSLRDLPRLRAGARRRESSWDRTGGNEDWLIVEPGQTAPLLAVEGAGSINHIWIGVPEVAGYRTAMPESRDTVALQELALEMYWDEEESPSVLVPLGAFFGATHAEPVDFVSAPIQVGPRNSRSFTSFFHMPFGSGARIDVRSESDAPIRLWYYVDYEQFDELEPEIARFHAGWNQTRFDGEPEEGMTNEEYLFGGKNLSGEGNYDILAAEGRGHYVGCFLSVHNLRQTHEWNWYGEGDDMIFIDGENWPPTLHGTGLEDYFDTTWCPQDEHASPYHGLIRGGGENWSGLSTYYRFHIEDPVPFRESIRVSIEHGHANRRPDELTSVAFWYQTEPHLRLTLPPAAERVPRPF